jgi:hypothetical protein
MRWTISSNARKNQYRKIVKAAAIIVKGLVAKTANDACEQSVAFCTSFMAEYLPDSRRILHDDRRQH